MTIIGRRVFVVRVIRADTDIQADEDGQGESGPTGPTGQPDQAGGQPANPSDSCPGAGSPPPRESRPETHRQGCHSDGCFTDQPVQPANPAPGQDSACPLAGSGSRPYNSPMPVRMPFPAIVGQDSMKLALLLTAVDPRIGGVLVRGERGTAKSTAARALAELLPDLEVFVDSPYNDDPAQPATWSDWARARAQAGEPLTRGTRRTPFIELPVSATEDRLVGTLDLQRALKAGERAFEPGLLAAANRGVLYIDEVNLLEDHLVDVLLDAAAMGENVVEREGISFSHPARFILIGTMNPEEGELRPQLLDRFAFSVEIQQLATPEERVQIMTRNRALRQDPEGLRAQWAGEVAALRSRIVESRARVDQVVVGDHDLLSIARLMSTLRVDGHRGELTIAAAACAHAAWEGRDYLTDEDLIATAPLALAHRLRRGPLDSLASHPRAIEDLAFDVIVNGLDLGDLETLDLGDYLERPGVDPDAPDAPASQITTGAARASRARLQDLQDPSSPAARRASRTSGKAGRKAVESDTGRGRYSRSRPAKEPTTDIAVAPTLRRAATRGGRQVREDGPAVTVEPEDIQRKVRVRRPERLVVFALDISYSTARDGRIELTKGVIESLLTEAYQQRDRVALIVFRDQEARVVLHPSRSVDAARRALDTLALGGHTPLSAALQAVLDVFTREQRSNPATHLVLVLISDAMGNVSLTGEEPTRESHRLADQLKTLGVASVVIDLEPAATNTGFARQLAEHLGGPRHAIQDLDVASLTAAIRGLDQTPATD